MAPEDQPHDLGAQTHALYAAPDVVRWYGTRTHLQPGEQALLERFRADLEGRRVLDLGVGGGRTTGHLRPLAASYVGLDYVEGLVEEARRRHPGADLSWGDARDLGRFADGSFETCWFSFNGIDSVEHEDRLRVLAEVRRVLVPGGLFLFSAHHRGWRRCGLLPWQGSPPLSRDTLRRSWASLRATRTRRRMRALEVSTPDYAIVNDPTFEHRLNIYYVDAAAQLRQLDAAGFTSAVSYDQDGTPGDPVAADPDSVWLHYSARA